MSGLCVAYHLYGKHEASSARAFCRAIFDEAIARWRRDVWSIADYSLVCSFLLSILDKHDIDALPGYLSTIINDLDELESCMQLALTGMKFLDGKAVPGSDKVTDAIKRRISEEYWMIECGYNDPSQSHRKKEYGRLKTEIEGLY
jgi:hypothetical protein